MAAAASGAGPSRGVRLHEGVMIKRTETYFVGELARLSGVSVRTLHHYDQIGLLKPAQTALNGYRVYGRAEALRLQEILFYRAMGLGLAGIAELLASDDDRLVRLHNHRTELAKSMKEAAARLAVLDRTIADFNGDHDMTIEELYEPFAPQKQAEYEAWLIETYGGDMAERIAKSKEAIQEIPDGMAGAMAELREIEAGLVELHEAGTAADDKAAHALLDQHRALMARLWGRTCPGAAFAGLAEIYLAHPDFVARYERLSPRFSQWLPAAMTAHAARLSD